MGLHTTPNSPNHSCTCNCKNTLALRYKHTSRKPTRSQQSYDGRIRPLPGPAPLTKPPAVCPALAQIREVRACSPAGEVDVVSPRSVQTHTCCSAPGKIYERFRFPHHNLPGFNTPKNTSFRSSFRVQTAGVSGTAVPLGETPAPFCQTFQMLYRHACRA